MFDNLSSKISNTLKNLRSKGTISESDVEETLADLRYSLFDADVAKVAVDSFLARVQERALETARTKHLNAYQQIVQILHEELTVILGGEERTLQFAPRGITVFMLCGLQGSGKTTLAGKIASWLKTQNKRVMLVAADLQRPGAIEQLRIVAERSGAGFSAPEPGVGLDSLEQEPGDPVKAARAGVNQAIREGYNVVIVDTAGRTGVDEVLLDQALKIKQRITPHETFFVIDSTIGQDAVNVARSFGEKVGFTAVALTKLDSDTRGGAALSVATVTGAPILFASTGEGLEDLELFHPDRMAGRILDLGDVMTLVEQAEAKIDEEKAHKFASRAVKGTLTFDDFIHQLEEVQKLGSMKNLLKMVPGAGKLKSQIDSVDDSELNLVKIIYNSMTPAERQDVDLLNSSRRKRIAQGSGTTVEQVNLVIRKFNTAKQVMRRLASGSLDIENLDLAQLADNLGRNGIGRSGIGKKAQAQAQALAHAKRKQTLKKKARSGNPAKRRLQELQALLPPEEQNL